MFSAAAAHDAFDSAGKQSDHNNRSDNNYDFCLASFDKIYKLFPAKILITF